MNTTELAQWKAQYPKQLMGEQRHVEVDGVHFNMLGETTLTYRYGNATGVIHSDSFFNAPGDYEPGCRVSPRYSDECRFMPLTQPTLAAVAVGVKESWRAFIS